MIFVLDDEHHYEDNYKWNYGFSDYMTCWIVSRFWRHNLTTEISSSIVIEGVDLYVFVSWSYVGKT